MRTIDLINQFENTDCTVKSFNSIFKGSQLTEIDDSITLEIGGFTTADKRVLELSDGSHVTSSLRYVNRGHEKLVSIGYVDYSFISEEELSVHVSELEMRDIYER